MTKGKPMNLSREGKLLAGVTLLVVPTVMYGGIALLSILTRGVAGLAPSGLALDETQWALWRAGHAHAGVWLILSLVMQVLIDSTRLSTTMMWLARISAPAAAAIVSAGFFGMAFVPEFRWLLYLGGLILLVALLLTSIGLLRNLRTTDIGA
jgi:hypothetical protein